MSDFQKHCVKIYEKAANIPTLDGVTVTSSDDSITFFWDAIWSQRDLERNAKVKYRSSGMLNRSGKKLIPVKVPCPTELNGEKIVRVSSCGKYRAVIREVLINSTKTEFLEIWNGSFRSSCINLTSEDKHGTVHSNSTFSCMEWSPDNQKLLYVAEKKQETTESFFRRSKKNDVDLKRGNEYVYKEDWGEQLVGCCNPTLVVYDVKTETISTLDDCVPDNMCVKEAIWCTGNMLIILALSTEPWKLGLMYCNTRPATLFELNIETMKRLSLTDGKMGVFSPRLSPDKHALVYLEEIPFGPHMQCSKMMCLDLSNKKTNPRVVIDVVNKCEHDSFHGLYLNRLPKNPWLKDSNKLVFSSLQQFNLGVFLVDVDSGEIEPLVTEESWSIQAICDDLLFVLHSNPNSPPQLKVGVYSGDGISWLQLDAPCEEEAGIKWQVFKHKPNMGDNEKYPGLKYESLLMQPKTSQVLGLIVNPHGGPHTSSTASFDMMSSALCNVGYSILWVNYRGSLGYGQDSIYSIPGNIGTQDVHDVQQAAEHARSLLALPKSKVFVRGGSHGGFLTLHLIAQYPDFYSAACVRNPVTNIASLVGTTDIPDWCFCESGQEFSYKYNPQEVNYKTMVSLSPIDHVHKVSTPLLMMVGSCDLRASPTQSHEYHRLLKAAGGKAKLLKYDNNDHPIAGVTAEADCFVNMCLWYDEHGDRQVA